MILVLQFSSNVTSCKNCLVSLLRATVDYNYVSGEYAANLKIYGTSKDESFTHVSVNCCSVTICDKIEDKIYLFSAYK